MKSSLCSKSFAKINLGLKIVNQRLDGYHNIKSIFIELDLYDTIEFIASNHFSIEFKGIHVPIDDNNTVYKAIKLLSQVYKINITHKIVINKKIPIGSGLGGGSSNAAQTLIGIDKLYNLNIPKEKLLDLGDSIGKDVPFFLEGGVKQVEGTGDILKNINTNAIKDKIFVLVIPEINISTRWAYSKIKKYLETKEITPKFPALTTSVSWELFENDFESFVCLAYPEILNIKKLLYKYKAIYSSLSGSGSTMFGIYNDIKAAKTAIEHLNKYHTYISLPIIKNG